MGNCICERTDITGKEIDTSPRRTKEICSKRRRVFGCAS